MEVGGSPHPDPSPIRGGASRRRGSSRQIERARAMRREPTEAERLLWGRMRRWRHELGLHVRRQVPIGPYIADFAILRHRLLIEVDGGQHAEGADADRDAWLEAQGHRVLRFWNHEVLGNADGVLETILAATSYAGLHPDPSPGGEGLRGASNVDGPPPPPGEGMGVGASALDRTDKEERE